MLKIFSKEKEMKTIQKESKNPDFSYLEQKENLDILEQEKLYQEGLVRVIDFISPSALGIYSSYLEVSGVFCRTIFISAYPKILSIGWVGMLIDMDLPMDISLFIHPVDTAKIIKFLRKKSTQIQSEIQIESEKGLVRDPVLEMAYRNVENLRDRLQEGVEKFFKFGLYVNIFGKTLDELEKNEASLNSVLSSRSIFYKKAIFRMKEGFDSCLPLCDDKLQAGINLSSNPLSTAFPFISTDISSNQGILYGINKHNNSLIIFDRFSMENYNMVVFAKSGSGKSYAVKLEVLRLMMMGVDAIIIDPEDEYRYLAETTGGSFVKISLTSASHINPFDLPIEDDKNMEEILRSNSANLLGLFRLMFGNITAEEDSILERAIKETYAIRDINNETLPTEITKENVPLMEDFYEVLKNMKGADDLSIRLEKYTKGIFSGFLNQSTNVSFDNQLIVFNIRDLEEELRPIAMYLVLHFIWNEIRVKMKKRVIVVDEAWIMMKNEDAANFLFSIAKRIRKYYGALTTITQDVADFMGSKFGKPIISNSSVQLLLRQSQSSIDAVADTFYLTEREKFLLLESRVGEGIFFAGEKRAAIRIEASYSEDRIITTNPGQRMQIDKENKDKKELEQLIEEE